MKNTRRLWASILFVLLLTGAALVGLASGRLSPTLGLDLSGGVAVILSAPGGTPDNVMEQALENIRTRVDAFGVGEPDIFLSGNTIEVQIPGAGEATIVRRQTDSWCLVDPRGASYGCTQDQQIAEDALDELTVQSQPEQVCLVEPDGAQLSCFSSRSDAQAAIPTLTVAPKQESSASPSPTPGEGPAPAADQYCITDAGNDELACYDSRKEAQDAKDGVKIEVTEQSFCVTGDGAATESTPSPEPTPEASSVPTPESSVSASPTPQPAFLQMDRSDARALPCGFTTRAGAETALAQLTATHVTEQFCVIGSAGDELGCFTSRDGAEDRRRETGQERLLQVIGQTARLEERPVLEILPPEAASTVTVTCPTPEERATPECSHEALRGQDVVYEGRDGTLYRLGPVVISGDNFKDADAVLQAPSQSTLSAEWQVSFDLDGAGSDAFAEATTRAVTLAPPQDQIAIVVDRRVISAPQVQSAITGGRGVITGSFTQAEAEDLATQLKAGALPVELTRQSVQTVSATLGDESLQQGIVAGLAGLLLLFLYMLFYYRILGIVAWFGMAIWGILAIALISVAGEQFGYALTLAGVAGLVISLGVTADSYIVFFERLKDEMRGGRTARVSVQPAFKRAFRTIVAADIVTGIAALVLYLTAVSSVRGFALTLGVATLLDLFVVYFFKRPTVFLLSRSDRIVNLRGFGLRSSVAADHRHLDEPGAEEAQGSRA